MATRTINSAITLPALTLAGTLQRPPIINAAITLPSLTLAATLQRPLVINADLTLPNLSIDAGLSIQVTRNIDADLTLPALTLEGALSLPVKIDAAIDLPALDVSASVRVLLRRTLTAHWAISSRFVLPLPTSWSMSARDAASALQARWALTVPARGQHTLSWFGPRVLASHSGVWSLRLGMKHFACWPVGNVTGELLARWSGPFLWAHDSRWDSAPVVRTPLRAQWACVPRVRTALLTSWQNLTSSIIRHRLEALWRGTTRLQANRSATWALRSDRRCLAHDAQWISSDQTRMMALQVARWAGVSSMVLPLPSITLTLSGQRIPISGCELRFDAETPAASAQVTPAIWPEQLPLAGTEVVLSIDGTHWQMVLTSGDGQATSPVTVETSLQLASPCIELENAEPVILPYGGLASEIAAAAVAPLNLTWNLPDWFLPPPLVTAHLSTLPPLAVAKALANAVGGLLMSLPSGDLVARSRQGGASIDLGCAIESERALATPEASGVIVRSEDPAASITVSGETPGIRTLDLLITPWRTVRTQLHAGSDARLSAPAEALRETVEQIQFVDGVAELSFAPVEWVELEWSDGSHRSLRYRGRWVWTGDSGFTGLCMATYRYRVLTLTASRTLRRDALAAVYELEKTV